MCTQSFPVLSITFPQHFIKERHIMKSDLIGSFLYRILLAGNQLPYLGNPNLIPICNQRHTRIFLKQLPEMRFAQITHIRVIRKLSVLVIVPVSSSIAGTTFFISTASRSLSGFVFLKYSAASMKIRTVNKSGHKNFLSKTIRYWAAWYNWAGAWGTPHLFQCRHRRASAQTSSHG